MNITIVIVLVLILVVVLMMSNKKEGYGGPVKKVQRIPRQTCFNICGQYYNRCLNEFGHIDSFWCQSRYNACKNQCIYSDFQRL